MLKGLASAFGLGDAIRQVGDAAKQAAASAPRCNKCGAMAAPGTKFCTECGGAIIQPAKDACPSCGAEVGGAKFCPECGTKIQRAPATCPSCGAEAKGSKFCPECGTKLL